MTRRRFLSTGAKATLVLPVILIAGSKPKPMTVEGWHSVVVVDPQTGELMDSGTALMLPSEKNQALKSSGTGIELIT